MGSQASVQTTSTTIDDSIINNLNQTAYASSSTNCDIKINSIIMNKSKNCTFKIVNNCSSYAGASFSAIMDTVKSLVYQMSTKQKTTTASLFTASLNVQTSITNISQSFENYINQECKAESHSNNSIDIDTINVGTCENNTGVPMVLEFINTGQSRANCVMSIINKLKAEAVTQVSATTEMGTDWPLIIKMIAICVCVFASASILGSLAVIFIKNYKNKYKHERTIAYINSGKSSVIDKYLPYV